MKLNDIRNELKNMRLYYAVLKEYPESKISYSNERYDLIKSIVNNAPRRIKDVFYGLYIDVNTQKQIALEWNVSEKYIQILNKRLLVYLQPLLPDMVKCEPKVSVSKVESREFTVTWLG